MKRANLIWGWILVIFGACVLAFLIWFIILNTKGETMPLVKEVFGYKLPIAIPRWLDIFIIPLWPVIFITLLGWKKIKEIKIFDRHHIGTTKPTVAIASLVLSFNAAFLVSLFSPITTELWVLIGAIIVAMTLPLILTEVFYCLVIKDEKSELKGFLGTFSLNILSGFSFGMLITITKGAVVGLVSSIIMAVFLIIVQNTVMKMLSFIPLLIIKSVTAKAK